MGQLIFYGIGILLMLVLLVTSILNMIDDCKTRKQWEEIRKKHIEYLDEEIKALKKEDE